MSRGAPKSLPPVADIEALAAYLSQRTGVSFAGSRGPQLRASIAQGVQDAGISNASEYLRLVAEDAAAFDALAGRLSVGETYFFRDKAQLQLLTDEILPTLRERGEVVRVWSAGCSTGEEAYTLAFLLEEAGLGTNYEILATDLSSAPLQAAEAGLYRRWSFRGVTPEQRRAYFQREPGGFRVAPRFRARITFRTMNLLDPAATPAGMDVVFCRNVLIYFTAEAVQRAAVLLAASLSADGWLVTGSSDPPLEVHGLRRFRGQVGFAYRRLDDALPPAARPRDHRPRARRVARQDSAHEPAVDDAPATAAALVRDVRALADAGRLADAAGAAAAAVTQGPLDAELRYLHALILLESGHPHKAVTAARTAVYLQPDLAVAHLALGSAQRSCGDVAGAQRSFRNARALQ